jgi:hypothetical protein
VIHNRLRTVTSSDPHHVKLARRRNPERAAMAGLNLLWKAAAACFADRARGKGM